MSEPMIPDVQGTLPDESGYQEIDRTDGKSEAKPANEDKAFEQSDKESERQPVSDERYQKLVEGWREDREDMQSEINRLKDELRTVKPTDDEEETLFGLGEDDRIEKIIEMRESKKKELSELELKQAQSEIRFYERTDPEFADNKKEILKVAADHNCPNLQQAKLIWRGIRQDISNRDANYNDKRKYNADGRSGGKSAGNTQGRGYSPKFDSNKSFADMFREGGVK